MKLKIIILSLFLIGWATNSFAGWVIKSSGSVILVKQNMVKAGPKARQIIFDLNKKEIIYLNQAKVEYWKGSPEEFRATIRKVAKKRLLNQIQELPKEQRKAFRKVIEKKFQEKKDQKNYQVWVVDKKKTDQLAGYQVSKHEIWVDGKLKEELWLANIPGLLKEWNLATFLEMSLAMSPGGYKAWQIYPQVLKIRTLGFALKSVLYGPKGQINTKTVQEIKKQDLSDKLFAPPSKYKKADLIKLLP